MAYLLGEPTVQQYFDVNGDPLVNGTVEFYVTGTSTPATIYSDSAGTAIGTSVTLNTLGAPENSGTAVALFFDTGVIYKIIRKDASGTPIPPTIDPYNVSKALTTFNTVADMLAADLAAGQIAETAGFSAINDGGADIYIIVDSTSELSSFVQDLANGRKAVSLSQVMSPLQVGYNLTALDMVDTGTVAANWAIMQQFLADIKNSTRELIAFDRIWDTESLHAEWVSGRSAPIGFYSDSTTDGATTTGHVASTGTDSPFEVTINESLNAYPKRLEGVLKSSLVGGSSLPIRAYNGGFDSQSFLNGFGLKQWYNTWFRGLTGSNVNYSDVKMIVIGFGTSDSINLDDTGAVIDAFSADLEAVIVDCFLRGVQPAIQTPVMTVQNTGNTVSGRKGWQSVSIIEAVQRDLADRYNIDLFSFSDSWRAIFSNFVGIEYRDLMSPDQVHPNDAGHNIHASYLATFFNKNIEMLRAGDTVNSLWAGHTVYQTAAADNIAPASTGGDILKYVPNLGGISDESYIYEWLASEGNGKSAGTELVRAAVYIDKPTALLLKDVDSNRTAKDILVQNFYLGSNAQPVPEWQTQDQPLNTFYSHKSFLTLLPPGVNVIYVDASNDSTDQAFGGLYLVDVAEMNFNYDRGTNLAKTLRWPNVLNAYTPQARVSRNRADYYNPQDQAFMSLSFNISTAIVSGTPVFVRTHYNDVSANKDSYNLFEFSADNFILKVVTDGAAAVTITTIAVPGLNALLVSGAKVELKMRSRFSTPNGLNVQLFVGGVVQSSYTAAVGDMWTDGYGFDTDILCTDISLVSSMGTGGFGDLNELI
jgi:hypothetical protein